MNATLWNADAGTHFKIVVLALLAATLVVWASILAN
jgi:hypothetical protein